MRSQSIGIKDLPKSHINRKMEEKLKEIRLLSIWNKEEPINIGILGDLVEGEVASIGEIKKKKNTLKKLKKN